MRRFLGLLLVLGAITSCRAPTEIALVLSTDVKCVDLRGTSVTVGRLGEIETKASTTSSTFCDASGDLGLLVVVPSGGKSDEVAMKIVAGVGRDADSCVPPYGKGCVVARRALHFLPHTPLRILVPLRAACNGVACGETETCVEGRCVGAEIADPGTCTGPGCDESVLAPTGDAGAEPSDGSPADANDASALDSGASLANRMFVTSSAFTGNLGGLAGADAICRAHARDAGLDGTFLAYLSTSDAGAASRLGSARGWVRTDGRPVADTAHDLAVGNLFYPVVLDEHGTEYTGEVRTGSDQSGNTYAWDGGATCTDWTSTAGSVTTGYAVAGSMRFEDAVGIGTCDTALPFYCLEVNKAAPVAPAPPANRRLAFLTTSVWPPGAGLASADTLCAAEAQDAGLPGSFRALLATFAASAAGRFDAGGPPWSRVDGVLVVAAAPHLPRDERLAPMFLGAKGERQTAKHRAGGGS
jgi:hypothetical protein